MQEIVFRGNDNQALTTSVIVAEKFGKEHSDVLKAIKSLFTTGEKSLFVENQQLSKEEMKVYGVLWYYFGGLIAEGYSL